MAHSTRFLRAAAGRRPPARCQGHGRRLKRWVARALLVACLALALKLSGTPGAPLLAQGPTTIDLSPTPASLAGCGTTTVEIRVNDVTDMYGADVRITFDPALLEVVDAVSGEAGVQILPLSGFLYPDWVIRNSVDNTAGTIWYAVVHLNPRPPASGSGSIARITFRGKQAGTSTLHFSYSKLATREGDPIPATAVDGSLGVAGPDSPLLSISRLNASDARLSWSSVSGVSEYRLYRDSAPYFTPGSPYQSTTGTSYDDLGALGDVATNHYYVVRSVCANGLPSANSNRVGEYDYALTAASAANYNDIAMVLEVSGVTDAASLATYVGSSVVQVARFNAAAQALQIYRVGMPWTNFPLSTGEFVFLITNSSAPASTALVGGVPEPGSISFSLVSGTPAQYNYLSLPLDRADLGTASAVAADVGSGIDRVMRFRIESQTYQSYSPLMPPTDFPLVIGEPFVLRLRSGAPANWP